MNSIPHFLLILFCLSIPFIGNAQTNPLSPCPKSPNCFRSEVSAKKELKQPIKFDGSILEAEEQLVKTINSFPRATQKQKNSSTLHYSFQTKLGKFIDDVHFYIDEANGLIHFRSASRVGWSDMGANRRRIKKIKKKFSLLTAE